MLKQDFQREKNAYQVDLWSPWLPEQGTSEAESIIQQNSLDRRIVEPHRYPRQYPRLR